mmetsp:Transcript_930/g.1986  ORF Transcript_930/g.1986 Transcript_930/m.1986 type:complete len:523 (-) Transcript_930:471-2039(-)|eukprot:CAMPEP_0172397614 /NCGR_PEP_ID=MMETSP1061-20121228/31705_1 /TAXON_ID=37318 /ORGANISM="Pseudo-nitzschia pungens, Strain cf. pungens" /LENGTH=522 /DNA_ID=CAMNT_0013129853 /DNA_START=213 /DNA_END=1781 /DNA_ORIENTATION=+
MFNGRFGHNNRSHNVEADESRARVQEYNHTIIDPQTIDNILTREMDKLSFKARNDIYEEVHGVASLAREETPELIEHSLLAMSSEIDRIKHKYVAYVEATRGAYNQYVHDMEIRLRFLRCELFVVNKAAVRMMKYLDLTRELFGTVALTRPVRLCDLGKLEMEMLRLGDAQPMPFRDRSGRRLMVAMNNFGLQFPLEVRIRVTLYLFWALGADEETQRKGVIGIVCWPSSKEAVSPDKFAVVYTPREASRHLNLSARMFECTPVRIAGIHVCLPDKPIYHMLRSGIALSIRGNASRLKFHCGDSIEIQYHLHGYGIPVDQIPITDTGNIKTKNLFQWIRVRKFLESSRNSGNNELTGSDSDCSRSDLAIHFAIDCPNMNDVIFRGKHACLSHPGNAMFRGLIESKYDKHNNATTTDAKVQLTWDIIAEVENKNGRFLVWDNHGCWREMTNRNQIRTKVAGALKDHKRRLKARQNLTTNNSSTFKFEDQDNANKKRKVAMCPDRAIKRCGDRKPDRVGSNEEK